MTPERLHLNEFGPYTKPQVVDFDELQAHQLFLIHGATGSGKSTLLDAICFALYGETSGSERDGDEMRSDFATPDEPTEVVLDFRLGETRYRVRRRPQQHLAKKRGEGTTRKSEKATLYDRSEATAVGEDGKPMADGKRDVDEAVEDLLGLAHEQFRQVVVLPQGKFRKFLSAGSTEREEILKVLFETGRYERLQKTLKDLAGEAKEKVQQLRQQRRDELARQDVEDVDALQEKKEDTSAAVEKLEKRKASLQKKLEDAREELEEAKAAQEVLDEREEAKDAVRELREEQEDHRKRKRQMEGAQRAAEVAPVRDDVATRRKEKEKADRSARTAGEAFREAEKALASARRDLQKEKEREEERDALRSRKTRLEDLGEDIGRLETIEGDLNEYQQKHETQTDALDEARETKNEIAEKLEEKKKEREEKERVARREELLEKEFEEAETLLEKARDLESKEDALQEARDQHEEKQNIRKAQEERLQKVTESLDALEERRREAYASVLASGLKEGTPCPVCGSEAHPAPAHESVDVPDEEDVESQRKKQEDAREDLEQARSEAREAESALTQKKTEVKSLKESYPALTEKTREEIEDDFSEAEGALEEARSAARDVEALTETIDDLETEADNVDDRIDELEDNLSEVQREVDRLETQAEEVRDRLPDEIATREDLHKAIQETTSELETLEAALEGARTAVQEQREDRAEEKQSALSRQSAAQQAAERLGDARSRFRRALQEADFDGETEFEAMRMEAEARKSLKAEVEAFEENWAAATDRLQRAEAAADDVQEPDVEEAEETVETAQGELDTVKEKLTRLDVEQEEIEATLEAVEAIREDLEAADERYRQVGFLSQLANGDNESRMSLQRFVLATRLEEVLQVANQHIAHMTQNRYRLLRAEDVGDRRSGSGLDLLVHDAYTGNRRPVATLSGGEGFMAALSLALGLSDVVQSLSGGRHLETIFIDEGFGSLDPEALDRSMEALSGLRDTGRLVGIISHVSELKQRVPARLEVTQTQEGSSLSLIT